MTSYDKETPNKNSMDRNVYNELKNFEWMTLKLHFLPLLMQETDFFIEKFINLVNEVRKLPKENQKSNDAKIKLHNKLRSKIQSRIIDIDDFYELNIHDSKVNHFEKMKIKLKKLLTYKPEVLNQIEYKTVESSSQRKFKQEQELKMMEVNLNQSSKDAYKSNHNNSNRIINDMYNDNKLTTSKSTYDRNMFNKLTDKKLVNNTNDVEIDKLLLERNINSIPNNWSEVCFRIKLTESEYKELMKEKSKNVRI